MRRQKNQPFLPAGLKKNFPSKPGENQTQFETFTWPLVVAQTWGCFQLPLFLPQVPFQVALATLSLQLPPALLGHQRLPDLLFKQNRTKGKGWNQLEREKRWEQEFRSSSRTGGNLTLSLQSSSGPGCAWEGWQISGYEMPWDGCQIVTIWNPLGWMANPSDQDMKSLGMDCRSQDEKSLGMDVRLSGYEITWKGIQIHRWVNPGKTMLGQREKQPKPHIRIC